MYEKFKSRDKISAMNSVYNDPEQTLAMTESAQKLPLLQQGCQKLGFTLNESQVAQFELFYRELVEWNQKLNLTAITDYQEVQTKHFLDSLVSLPLLAEALNQPLPITQPLHCIDVGTGAGFPGLPLKIAMPRLRWTLMDGTGKKVQFLSQLVAKLQLEHISVVQGRAEELGKQSAYRAQFDLVTARAVAPLNTLVEYLLPLVRRDGWAMIYKGASAPQEFMEARQAVELLGGEAVRLAPVQVPFMDEKRFVLLIKKVRPTPNLYPRPQGLARKKPLA
ncbi:MAG: 16S rRNA (guanine(527)-N(7))-methyltransferase RsmG [Caldilineaceae bacterium]